MSRKNRDFFREKSEFLRDRLLLLFIDIARRGLLIAYQGRSLTVPDKISTLRFAEVVFGRETLHKEP